jgi:DNA-binding winged helix-turn-helix (wHTH) protein
LPRYRFANFVVSPRRRLLLRDGLEQPLIPRYFDLLVFLLERRHEAVHRRDIFDKVWSDVVVSDSALSQAVRTLRRTLADDSREPRFIRTVSRHGYRFVFAEVSEEPDEEAARQRPMPEAPGAVSPAAQPEDAASASPDAVDALLDRITRPPAADADEEEQREAAEILHTIGTSEALRQLGDRPGHELGRALLRETRWDSPTAGPVPIVGVRGSVATAAWLVRMRLRRAARIAALRWASAALGAGLAGGIGGALGGLLLAAAPGSHAPETVALVLALIGGVCGATGGAGVGAGLAVAETVARSRRGLALVAGGAAGGLTAGAVTQVLGQVTLANLVGIDLPIGGALDGIAIGAAAGLGYALGTSGATGLAAPRGRNRSKTVVLTALACALATWALTVFAGRPLVGGTIHMIANAARGAQVSLTPFGHLVGEPDFGPLSRTIIGTLEGALFGLGLASGLTRRPRRYSSASSHETLTSR